MNAKSITFTLTSNGRASGECYVELDDQEAVKEAQKLDRNEINGRYIEGLYRVGALLFPSERIFFKRIWNYEE